MPRPICVVLDLRGHGEEILDQSYMQFLERAFAHYGEECVYFHTDATPLQALAPSLLPGQPPPPSYRALLAAHIAAAPPLPPRERMPKAAVNCWKSLGMWLRWTSFDAEAVLAPLLRTLFSARCWGGYVPSAAALKASLRAFLLEVVAPAVPAGAPVHCYWASHGNFLVAPALSSRRGIYGVVALRSEEEKATMADTSLSADFIGRELVVPLAQALAGRRSALVWSQHSCWAAPIMGAAALALAPLLTGTERLCLLADKPLTAPFKRLVLAPYNDNLAFVLPWAEGTLAGLRQAVAGLLACLPGHEAAAAAMRVRWELERELKSRAVSAAAQPPHPAHQDAPRPPLTLQQLRALWPATAKEASGTPKGQWAAWEFGVVEGGAGAPTDARFAAAYQAAQLAGLEMLEGELAAAPAPVALNAAVAAALRAAAAALRSTLPALPALQAAQAALQAGASTGFVEAAMEEYYLSGEGAAGAAAAAAAAAGAGEEEVLTGGAAVWAQVSAFAGADRPRFTAYLRSVGRASAELSAAQAPLRLEALASVLQAMAPQHCAEAFMGHLRGLCFNSPLNNVGDQSSGGHFGSRIFLDWLRAGAGGSAKSLERHMYGAWARWAVGAEGEGAVLAGEVYDAAALQALTAFPEALEGRTGIVHTWGIGAGYDLGRGEEDGES